MSVNPFKIGDIVTLKSHPLAFQENGEIEASVNQIPPFMCVKEIHIDKKKQIYSQDIEKAKIGDNIKYLCVYFNQHRMIFEEKFIYHEMLLPLAKVTFHSKMEKEGEDQTKLIDETESYKAANYQFGKRVFFKTYKLEKRKKFKTAGLDSNSSTKTILTHTSPAFILDGYKKNDQKSIYNPKNGELIKKCSEELHKVLWYNSYQEKFSEEYLPKEFLTDDSRIYTSNMSTTIPLNGKLSEKVS